MQEFLIQVFPTSESPKIFRFKGTPEAARQQAVLYLKMGFGNVEKVDLYSPWGESENSFSPAIDTIYFDKNL